MEPTFIAFLISSIRTSINKFLIQELEDHGVKGLAPSHGSIIFYLFNTNEATMKEISVAVHRDKSTVTALIAKLVDGGYVQKEQSSQDQRSIIVRLTPKGEALKPIVQDVSDKMLSQVWKNIPEDDKAQAMSILESIWANFN